MTYVAIEAKVVPAKSEDTLDQVVLKSLSATTGEDGTVQLRATYVYKSSKTGEESERMGVFCKDVSQDTVDTRFWTTVHDAFEDLYAKQHWQQKSESDDTVVAANAAIELAKLRAK